MARYLLWLMFSWRGRIGKGTFILAALTLYMFKYVISAFGSQPSAPLAILLLTAIWAGLALCAKRLHDLNWSSRWLLLLVPLLVSIVGLLPHSIGAAGFGYLALVILLVVPLPLIYALALRKGDTAPNAYGVRRLAPALFETVPNND
jgi:uncharacterized membrane protein YhaH (DUF805 family)